MKEITEDVFPSYLRDGRIRPKEKTGGRMTNDLILMASGAALAVAWSIVNGQHRRDVGRRGQIQAAADRFPPETRRKLLRLVQPSRLNDRLNHALVIAGCCTIICVPAYVAAAWLGFVSWTVAPILLVVGTIAGAVTGELALNSWGCATAQPTAPTDPPTAPRDAAQDQ